jgi:hypothetical protein
MAKRKHQRPSTQMLKHQAAIHSEIRRVTVGSPMPQEHEAKPDPNDPTINYLQEIQGGKPPAPPNTAT